MKYLDVDVAYGNSEKLTGVRDAKMIMRNLCKV